LLFTFNLPPFQRNRTPYNEKIGFRYADEKLKKYTVFTEYRQQIIPSCNSTMPKYQALFEILTTFLYFFLDIFIDNIYVIK